MTVACTSEDLSRKSPLLKMRSLFVVPNICAHNRRQDLRSHQSVWGTTQAVDESPVCDNLRLGRCDHQRPEDNYRCHVYAQPTVCEVSMSLP